MKKPKKLNKFLAGAGAVFAILLAWSVKTVYTPPRLLEAEDAGSPRTTKWGSVLLPPEPTWDLGRIRGSNFFPKPSTPRRGASASDPPADEKNPVLGKNDVLDPVSGDVFKFIGAFRRGLALEACFLRVAKEGGPKVLCLLPGETLTPRLRLEEIRDTVARIRRGDEIVELKVFSIDLREKRK